MFERPFSFEGRIRRTEYGLSILIYAVVMVPLQLLLAGSAAGGIVILIALIPLLWFMIAQAAKRCHDRGNTGWFQIIPLYGFWMLFAEGDYGQNDYGPNPKGLGNDENAQPSDDIIPGQAQ